MSLKLNNIFIFFIIGTLLFNSLDFIQIMLFNVPDVSFLSHYSSYLKFLRMLIYGVLFIFAIYYLFKKNQLGKNIVYAIFIFACFCLYLSENLLFYLQGMVLLMPFIFIILFLNSLEEFNFNKILKIIIFLFIINITAQIIQYLFYNDLVHFVWSIFYEGKTENIISIIIRNPGIFNMPNLSALLGLISLFIVYYYISINNYLKIFLLILGIISIILTKSGTAMATLIICMFILLLDKFYKYKNKIIICFIPLIVMIYFVLEKITYRVGLFKESFGQRIEWFKIAYDNTEWFSTAFGQAGNLIWKAYLSNYLNQKLLYADSFLTVILINFGKFIFFLNIIMIIILFIWLYKNNNFRFMVLITIFLLFSFTMSVVEAYPVNLILSFLIAFEIKNIMEKRYV